MSTPVCTLQKYVFAPSFPHEHGTIQASANPTAIFAMQLSHGLHLAYSTNIHRGETWRETFDSLKTHALAVREKVCPRKPFAIGLRLGNQAATELQDPKKLLEFQRWLGKNDCYIFTINGFPFGKFHGARVKEKVYLPDWTSHERVAYTNLLFDLLAQLLPAGIEGSVSTVPGSFKEFVKNGAQKKLIRKHIFHCVEHISRLAEKSKHKLHLGLEPEPLCLIENSAETTQFFAQLRAEHKNDPRLNEFLGVNYDCCHFAIEFEEPQNALVAFQNAGIKISKIHLSSALKTKATKEARAALKKFADDVYLHQVVVRGANGKLKYFRDLPDALAAKNSQPSTLNHQLLEEWRIHFHVPLHAPAAPPFENTNDHLLGVLDLLAENPKICPHLEMETYTWEVLPPELKSRGVVGQLVAEYDWTLARLAERGLL
ncbi:MAG TPA: metabolite traffic protein EboE [Verrucomicrobiae bacterium]